MKRKRFTEEQIVGVLREKIRKTRGGDEKFLSGENR